MLEKTLRWIVHAGVFALPFICLIVSSSLFFPYITGKNFAFRIIVEVIFGAWLALAIVYPAYRPKRSLLLGALAVFVAIMFAADAFGAYPFKSLWSNYERMDGWVTIAHLLLYTVVAASVLVTEKLWRRLFWTSLGVSVYVAIYGLLQVAGKVALGLNGTVGLSGRIDGTFGNPIYLAVYMLFHIFIAAMLWAQQWVEKGPGNRLVISLSYGGIIALDTLALLLSGTRGTILGLVGGAFLTAFLMLVLARNSRNVWRASIGAVASIIILAGAFYIVRDQAWIQKIGFLQRMASISVNDQTTQSRFVNWSIAWNGVKERPILGWGQENYALVFDKYYDPRMYKQEPWFDRVHNIVFDWLVAGGFLGLLSYLAIFLAALWALWRSGGFTIAERSLLTGLMAGYFVHNFFVFDNVTSYILFGTILAYIAYRAAEAKKASPIFSRSLVAPLSMPYVALACVVLVLFAAWGVNQRALAANREILLALGNNGDILKNLQYFEQSIARGTYGMQEAREQLSQMTSQMAGVAAVPMSVKEKFYEAATREMDAQHAASPLDARFPLFKAVVQSAYGQYDLAEQSYAKAQELSPKKQSIMIERAQNALNRNNGAQALALTKTAYELDTRNTNAAISYASLLIRAGQYSEAETLLKPYVVSGDAANQAVLTAYSAVKQLQRAAPLWQARIAAHPDDMQAYFTLAAIYYSVGNRAQAVAVLEQAKKANPAVATQADPLIQQIKNGTAVVN